MWSGPRSRELLEFYRGPTEYPSRLNAYGISFTRAHDLSACSSAAQHMKEVEEALVHLGRNLMIYHSIEALWTIESQITCFAENAKFSRLLPSNTGLNSC